MEKILIALSFILLSLSSFAQEGVCARDTVYIAKVVEKEQLKAPVVDRISKNNWGATLKESNFHLGLDLQTKYIWRGMEMVSKESSPVLFPCINYQWQSFYVYTMGGYALNGKYAEVDMGMSYTWKGLSISLNNYYYPTIDRNKDEYFGGSHNGHWLEAAFTYAPENIPVWFTASNFFAGDDDKYVNANGEMKRAFSTYCELGTYYDFLNSNRISFAVGFTPNKSCYNGYEHQFSVCNIDLKYTYNANFKSGWNLPLSAQFVYNPVYDKPFLNLIANFAF